MPREHFKAAGAQGLRASRAAYGCLTAGAAAQTAWPVCVSHTRDSVARATFALAVGPVRTVYCAFLHRSPTHAAIGLIEL